MAVESESPSFQCTHRHTVGMRPADLLPTRTSEVCIEGYIPEVVIPR